jgi:hypothetical protein
MGMCGASSDIEYYSTRTGFPYFWQYFPVGIERIILGKGIETMCKNVAFSESIQKRPAVDYMCY